MSFAVSGGFGAPASSCSIPTGSGAAALSLAPLADLGAADERFGSSARSEFKVFIIFNREKAGNHYNSDSPQHHSVFTFSLRHFKPLLAARHRVHVCQLEPATWFEKQAQLYKPCRNRQRSVLWV